MSVQAISCAFALRGISSSEKLVMLALANYADENMQCWPSKARIASDTGLTDRTIRSVFASLEASGLLGRSERFRRDGSQTTDLISLYFGNSAGAETISGGAENDVDGAEIISGGAEAVSALTTFEPSLNRQKEPSPSAEPRKRDPKGFAEFWKAYPRKVGKGDARKKFDRAVKVIGGSDPLSVLLRALDTAKAVWVKERREPQHIPHPATWLNQERWEDEPLASPKIDTPSRTFRQADPGWMESQKALIDQLDKMAKGA